MYDFSKLFNMGSGVPTSYGKSNSIPGKQGDMSDLMAMFGGGQQGSQGGSPDLMSMLGGGGQGQQKSTASQDIFASIGQGQGPTALPPSPPQQGPHGVSTMGYTQDPVYGKTSDDPLSRSGMPPSPSGLPDTARNPIGKLLGDPDMIDPVGGKFGMSPTFGDADRMVRHIMDPAGEAAERLERMLREGMGEAKGYEKSAEEPFDMYQKGAPDIYKEFQRALGEGKDPSELLNSIMGSYRMSPEVQKQLEAGQTGANRAAAAGGMLGSSSEMQQAAQRAQSMRSDDMQKYLQNALGLRQQYLGGLSGLEGQGFRGAEDISNLRNMLGQQILKSYGDIGKAQAAGSMGGGNMLSNLGSIAGIAAMFI